VLSRFADSLLLVRVPSLCQIRSNQMSERLLSKLSRKQDKSEQDSRSRKLDGVFGASAREGPYTFLCQLAKGPYCGLGSTHQMIQPGEVSWGPVIGKGAYAVVHLSSSCEQQRTALKQLKPTVAEDKVELKFFLLEAHIISLMMHECASWNVMDHEFELTAAGLTTAPWLAAASFP
jgi:hypothetical protein